MEKELNTNKSGKWRQVTCSLARYLRIWRHVRNYAGCEQMEGIDIMCEIADRIRRETDLSVLGRWIRCAASASSIAEFEARM